MSATTTPTTQVARKPHSCSICGTTIHVDSVYERWRYFGDGASVVKVHPDCWAFFRDHDITEWDDDTFGEHLTGWLSASDAQEALNGCSDPDLREVWQRALEGAP
jgi:hypothetical protein